MEKLLKLYEGLLSSLDLQVDDQGLVSFAAEDGLFPVKVGDRRLALPTEKLLRSGQWDGLQPFHPLSEHILRGESAVLKKLRTAINIRLSTVISGLLTQLVELGADTSRHKRLSPKASELLSHLKDADPKSVAAMERILEETSPEGPNKIISIYLKRGGIFKGTRHQRVAVVSFPIYGELDTDGAGYTVFGIKLRKKDFVAFRELFLFLLPDAFDLESYSAASQSNDAPYFDSLIHAYFNVATQLNRVVKDFTKYLTMPEDLFTDLSWIELASDLSEYRNLIPALPGNEGTHDGKEDTSTTTTTALTTTTAVPEKVSDTVAKTVDSSSSSSLFNTHLPKVEVAQPVSSAFGTHTTTTAKPAGETDRAGVVHTSGGLDLNSLLSARERALRGGYVTTQPQQTGWQSNWGTPPPGQDPNLPGWAQGGSFGFHNAPTVSSWNQQPSNAWGNNTGWGQPTRW